MIRKLLIVNPDNRPRLEDIKRESFYKKGMKLLGEDVESDYNFINEQVYLNMNHFGFLKDEVIKNVESKKFNNIRTTYELLYNKLKLHPNPNRVNIQNKNSINSNEDVIAALSDRYFLSI